MFHLLRCRIAYLRWYMTSLSRSLKFSNSVQISPMRLGSGNAKLIYRALQAAASGGSLCPCTVMQLHSHSQALSRAHRIQLGAAITRVRTAGPRRDFAGYCHFSSLQGAMQGRRQFSCKANLAENTKHLLYPHQRQQMLALFSLINNRFYTLQI